MKLFHYGVVVDDVERAMADYSRTTGLTWADVTPRPVRVRLADDAAPVGVELLATYSRQGPPYLELIEERRGGIWSDQPRLDHLGFWVPDLAADTARLRSFGLTRQVQALDHQDQPTRFVYLRAPDASGPWLELVDEAIRPQLESWVNGSAYVVS